MGAFTKKIARRFHGHFRGVAVFALLVAALILFSSLFIVYRRTLPDGTIRLYFVDVGQGDASFLTTASGNVLIDAGTAEAAPTLYHTVRKRGNTLRYLIITHPHDDHMGGASYILEKMDVEAVILPTDTSESAEYRKFMTAVEAEGAEILYAAPALTVRVDQVVFTFLSPSVDTGDLNENSAVLRMDYGRFSALFTGDAGAESEKIQLNEYGSGRGGPLDADILKVGHHGSDTSSTAAYLAAVTPRFAVISCGENNAYGHPDPGVLARLREADATVLRTDLSGTVVITIDRDMMTVKGRRG